MNAQNAFKKTLEYEVVEELSKSVRWQKDSIIANTDSERLAAVCEALVKAGALFDSAVLCGPIGENRPQVCYAFLLPALKMRAKVFARGRKLASVSSRIDAARWDERKMQDLGGIHFEGIQDSRPLLAHPESGWKDFAACAEKNRQPALKHSAAYESREYPIESTDIEGEFEIPVGPVHAGIIEPGHFRFFVSGEDIHKMETRMFYLHRGLERQAVDQRTDKVFPLIEQVSGDESVANAVAYAQAVEELSGEVLPSRAESLRLVLLELERIYNHLADLGGIATDVGYYASSSKFALLREEMMRLNFALCGSRFLRGQVCIGGLKQDIAQSRIDAVCDALTLFSKKLDELETMTLSSSTFLDRVYLTGRVSLKTAENLALVGPAARASGRFCDLRRHFPYGAYKRNAISESMAASGDVLARFNVKTNEIKESIRLIQSEIRNAQDGPVCGKTKAASGFGWGLCEAPRGACSVFALADKGKIKRLSIRTASFRNWRALEQAVSGNIVPDFPLINKSFNLSYAGTDL